MKFLKKSSKKLIILLFWLLVWQLLSAAVAKELLLPAPLTVLSRLCSLALTAQFWHTTLLSLLRILCGMVTAVIFGTLLAILTCRFALLRDLLTPLITIVKSTPVASFIILALVWMGRNILPSFIAVLMVLPVVWTNISTGIVQTSPALLEVAKIFRFSRAKTLRCVYIPSVLPYFLSACRTSLGLAWKAGIAAEVLTVPGVSIGKMLYESKQYLETVDLFAWTLTVILCSLVIEKVLMAAVERLSVRCRTEVNSCD